MWLKQALPPLPFPEWSSSMVWADYEACGLKKTSDGIESCNLYTFPFPSFYLERFANPHYRAEDVAVITEEKLFLSLCDITDIDVDLEGKER